jgi:hypothetical protein
MAARRKTGAKRKKVRDWKLVLADIRRTESDLDELEEGFAVFRETLDLAKKRLAFIRACVEKRLKERAQ